MQLYIQGQMDNPQEDGMYEDGEAPEGFSETYTQVRWYSGPSLVMTVESWAWITNTRGDLLDGCDPLSQGPPKEPSIGWTVADSNYDPSTEGNTWDSQFFAYPSNPAPTSVSIPDVPLDTGYRYTASFILLVRTKPNSGGNWGTLKWDPAESRGFDMTCL